MADETTLRKFDRELGAHDARLDHLESQIKDARTELGGKLDQVLTAVQAIKEENADRRAKERIFNGGIALGAGALVSFLLKKVGG